MLPRISAALAKVITPISMAHQQTYADQKQGQPSFKRPKLEVVPDLDPNAIVVKADTGNEGQGRNPPKPAQKLLEEEEEDIEQLALRAEPTGSLSDRLSGAPVAISSIASSLATVLDFLKTGREALGKWIGEQAYSIATRTQRKASSRRGALVDFMAE